MKFIAILALAAIGAAFFWHTKIQNPPEVKAYRQYRKEAVTAKSPNVAGARPIVGMEEFSIIDTKLKVIQKAANKEAATIEAEETTRWMPPNAAGANFAWKAKARLHAELALVNGVWTVSREDLLEQKVVDHRGQVQF